MGEQNQGAEKRTVGTLLQGAAAKILGGTKATAGAAFEATLQSETVYNGVESAMVEGGEKLLNHAKVNNQRLIAETVEVIDPKHKGAYTLLTESIAPKGGFIRELIAKVLHVGAAISATVFAIFIDQWAETNYAEYNTPSLEVLFAWLLARAGGIFGPKQQAGMAA